MTRGDTSPEPDAGAAFRSELELVDRVATWVCRRNHVSPEDADDFVSYATLHVIENDYAVLRKFQGRSTLRTFLTVVIQRLFLDYRIREWGKWRPSSQAQSAGPIAVELERLLTRDGHPFEEACELLSARQGADRASLERLAGLLPSRMRRTFETEEALSDVVTEEPSPDDVVSARERQSAADHASAALDEAMQRLDPQDRLIVALHFHDGRTVADIAALLRLDAKPLYRRLERLLQGLRKDLEGAGVNVTVVRELLESSSTNIRLDSWVSRSSAKPDGSRPSMSLKSGVEP